MRTAHHQALTRARQRGAALLVMLVLLITGGAYLLVSQLNRASGRIETEQKTAAALAQAKEALIGYAAGDANRPGELPCPDIDNDGRAVPPVEYISVPGPTLNCARLIGRLPWRNLDLPDLRDGNGERLWYAVSDAFHAGNKNVRLNSDVNGAITVRDPTGAIVLNGTNQSAAIAVIFSPGAVITRQGAALPQDRSCVVGVNCDTTEKCTTTPATLTPKCNPVNYLDIITGIEDNADDFIGGSATNGFISGEIRNPLNHEDVWVNDRLLTITHDDLFRVVEQRVAREVKNTLLTYATNCGSYPWAAQFKDPSTTPTPITYSSFPLKREGLLPASSAQPINWGGVCGATTAPTLPPWVAAQNWPWVMYYAIAVPACIPGTNCLTVNNTPNPTDNKQALVIMTGRTLAGIHPSGRLGDYLEGQNQSTPDNIFQYGPATPSFNDQVIIVAP